ncbi:hypothetical protein MMC17_009761, partial [Xylographa soralifera]|nr:hypothetical protein [Xylographa soralifera]
PAPETSIVDCARNTHTGHMATLQTATQATLGRRCCWMEQNCTVSGPTGLEVGA